MFLLSARIKSVRIKLKLDFLKPYCLSNQQQ